METRGEAVKVIADTNVIAYYLLGTEDFYAETREFWDSTVLVMAPVHWQAEWANVVWLTARAGVFPWADVPHLLAMANRLAIWTEPLPPLWAGAVARSARSGVAVYDTLFIELAVQQDCRLVTFDQQVLRAFPGIACRPRDLLAS